MLNKGTPGESLEKFLLAVEEKPKLEKEKDVIAREDLNAHTICPHAMTSALCKL
jgi:hypothetical protein